MRFSALMLSSQWVTFAYFPIAHMVRYWAEPGALADAARAVSSASAHTWGVPDLIKSGAFEMTEVVATRSPLSIIVGQPLPG